MLAGALIADSAGDDLWFDENGIPNADEWHDLVQCAWALLSQNVDLIEWLVCLLGTDLFDGDCILSKILNEEPRIVLNDKLDKNPNNPIAFGYAGINPVFVWGAGVIGALTGGAGGLAAGLGIAAAAGPTHIVINVNSLGSGGIMAAYRQDPMCGCIAMAALLLHEVSHFCLRDFADTLRQGANCPFASMLGNSFQWMLAQRYQDYLGSPSCCDGIASAGTTWMAAPGGVPPDTDCGTVGPVRGGPGLWIWLGNAAATVWEAVWALVDAAGDAVAWAGGVVFSIVDAVVNVAMDALMSVVDATIEVVQDVTDAVVGFLKDVLNLITTSAGGGSGGGGWLVAYAQSLGLFNPDFSDPNWPDKALQDVYTWLQLVTDFTVGTLGNEPGGTAGQDLLDLVKGGTGPVSAQGSS